MKRTLLLLLALVAGASHLVAGEHPEHPTTKTVAKDAPMIEATVTGQNICQGCTLKSELGAQAQCSTYGHEHVLRVTSAVSAGKDRPEMKGWVLSYLKTDHSQPYISAHGGETLSLNGKVYPDFRVFEVAKSQSAVKPAAAGGHEHPEGSEHPKGAEHPGSSK